MPILLPMSRPPKDQQASADLGNRLTVLKEKREKRAGYLSNERIAREMWSEVNYPISAEQVRKYHAGQVDPHTVHLEEIAAVAEYYRVPLRKLSPIAFERGHTHSDLLIRSFGWITGAELVAA